MMKKEGLRRLLCGLGGVCLFLFVFGAAPALAEVGVTDDEILIGTSVDMSGPIAHLGKSIVDSSRAIINYHNEVKGGVHGRKIRLIVEDDGYQSPRAVQAARKLVTRDRVFCMFMVLGSTGANAMYPFLEAQRIPLLFPGTQERTIVVPPRRYLFLSDTTYYEASKIAVEFMVEELGIPDRRIAVIYQDDMPGHDWLHGIKVGADHYGFDVLKLPYRRGAVDFSTHVMRAKNAGITHVAFWGVFREAGLLWREALRQEFKATYYVPYPCMAKRVLDLGGREAVGYTNAIYGFGGVLNYESRHPTMLMYAEAMGRAGLDYTDEMYGSALGYAWSLIEALERTGRDLTRERLIETLEGFEDVGNGLMPPLTYGPDRRDGARGVIVGVVRDMEWTFYDGEGIFRYATLE